MDKWLKARRSRFGANLVSMRQLPKTLVQIKDQPSCVLLIVDQNPSNPAHAHGAEFFGQTSAFLSGMARLAVHHQFDVIYIDGDHKPLPLMKDLQNAKKLIKDGGYICGHDYNETSWIETVRTIECFFGKEPDKVYDDSSWVYKVGE